MRVGQNPIKAVERIEPPAPVTVVVISFVPFLSGYYTYGLDLLKLCLGSIHKNTQEKYDLMVFDNGSCLEVRNFLIHEQSEEHIQFLILSEFNLGKPAAWNFAFASAPGEFVAYADSDVYFYNGWLKASLEALSEFPQAGMVTAMPILTPQQYSSSTIQWAQKQDEVKVDQGNLLPWEDFWRHARSLGDTEETARQFYNENHAVRLTHKGKKYFAGAAHFQFMARKAILQEVLPIPAERPMGQVRLLDKAIDESGYLRLSTDQWFVQHLGNQLPSQNDFVKSVNVNGSGMSKRVKRRSLWGWPPLRKILQRLNGWTFERLHRSH